MFTFYFPYICNKINPYFYYRLNYMAIINTMQIFDSIQYNPDDTLHPGMENPRDPFQKLIITNKQQTFPFSSN